MGAVVRSPKCSTTVPCARSKVRLPTTPCRAGQDDFFWPLVMTIDDTVRTLPVGVAMLREGGTGARWHIIMAGSMFVVAPLLAVFVVAQPPIIRAVTFARLK